MPMSPGVKPFTVSKVTQAVKAWIEEQFASVWVCGEVSGFKHHRASGHMYFNLKDDAAVIPCVMFRGSNLRLRFDPHDGQKVVVRGGISVYESQGKYQVYVEEMYEQGVGEAEQRLRDLREKLRARGYFDDRHTRPLPKFPRLVALVTSGSGAAVRDMLELLRQRWPISRVVVRPTRVQGPGAGADIAANVRLLSGLHEKRAMQVCAIVIGRGGGAREDLAAFNEECVADAIFDCCVPVISAVGHETDVSIADLVADWRAETPSAAISGLVPDAVEQMGELLRHEKRLRDAILSRVALGKQAVDHWAGRPAFRKPFARLRDAEQRVDELSDRLKRAADLAVKRSKDRLAAASEQLGALSPLNVLSRGYSLTQRGDGAVVRRAADVAVGEVLTTRVAEGQVVSRVLSKSSAEGEADVS